MYILVRVCVVGDVIIGAGSVLTRDIPTGVIIAGNSAKIISIKRHDIFIHNPW